MILKEYVCLAHGPFEAGDAVCPYGCTGTSVSRAFFTAPNFHSERTTNIDRTLDGLAKKYGLTDMNNDGGRGAVKKASPESDSVWKPMTESVTSSLARYGAPTQNNLALAKPALERYKAPTRVAAKFDAKVE